MVCRSSGGDDGAVDGKHLAACRLAEISFAGRALGPSKRCGPEFAEALTLRAALGIADADALPAAVRNHQQRTLRPRLNPQFAACRRRPLVTAEREMQRERG